MIGCSRQPSPPDEGADFDKNTRTVQIGPVSILTRQEHEQVIESVAMIEGDAPTVFSIELDNGWTWTDVSKKVGKQDQHMSPTH